MTPTTVTQPLAAAAAPLRRAADRPPAVPAFRREASPRSDVFRAIERGPGLARPQGSVVSLAG